MLLKNKSIKVAFLSSLITAIITGTIGVIAVSLTAKDIAFTSIDENWQANNVEDAMNDLYNISTNCSSTSIINLGTDTTYDLKTEYEKYGLTENQYQELTADNFIVSYNKISASGSGNLSGTGGGTANTIKSLSCAAV